MSHEHHGECLYCGAANLYSSLNCRSCHTQLPWAPALTQMLAQSQPQAQIAPIMPLQASLQAQPPAQAFMQPGAPKYCAHCGSGHSPSARFCAGCGTAILAAQHQQADAPSAAPRFGWSWPLQGAAPASAQAAMAPMPTQGAQGAQGGFMFSPQQSVHVNVVTDSRAESKAEHKKRGRGWQSRLFGLFSIICAGLALFVLVSSPRPELGICAFLGILAATFAALAK